MVEKLVQKKDQVKELSAVLNDAHCSQYSKTNQLADVNIQTARICNKVNH